jgi:hypothetical protein
MAISIPLMLLIVIFVALVIAFGYRRTVAASADELVHLSDVSDAVLAKQEATAGRIQQLDRIVMILAIVFVVYGVALGGITIFRALSS